MNSVGIWFGDSVNVKFRGLLSEWKYVTLAEDVEWYTSIDDHQLSAFGLQNGSRKIQEGGSNHGQREYKDK